MRAAWLQLRDFCGLAGDVSYLRPRWIVIRAVGLIYILIFAGIIATSQGLIGPRGIYPVAEFFARLQRSFPGSLQPFVLAPSLFWLNPGRGMILAVEWIGLAAAVAALLNVWPRMALFACWLVFLSFYSACGVFVPDQIDILLLEAALLCVPFAPAGLRPGLGAGSPPRPIALFAMRWLLFRVMFESGLVKIIAGDPHWRNFTAMRLLYETAPFPTVLGYLAAQLPQAFHVFEIAFTFLAELAAPLLAVFGGRRGRWVAFAVWTVFQIGIELTCNFGWLNLAAIALGFVLLDDQMLAALRRRAARGRRPGADSASRGTQRAVPPARRFSPWRLGGLRAALGAHFCLTLICFFGFVRTLRGPHPGDVPPGGSEALDFFLNLHSANAYTLYARFHTVRDGVEFAGSNDGGRTWRTYDYRYLSQRVDRMCPFLAPWYPRFEGALEGTELETGKDQSQSKSSLYRAVAVQLVARNPEVIRLFPRDPFRDRPATMIRLRYFHLSFTDFATYRKTGHFWRKEYKGDYLPMIYADGQGRIVESDVAAGDAAAREGNYSAALAIYERQYQVGYPYAGLRLANLLTRGLGTPRDPGRAFAIYADLAARGEVEAGNELGLCYENGIGAPVDYARAAAAYRLAAGQESLSALYNLGGLYAKDRVRPDDPLEGLTLLREAWDRATGDATLDRYIRRDPAGYVGRLERRLTPEAIERADRQAAERVKNDQPLGS